MAGLVRPVLCARERTAHYPLSEVEPMRPRQIIPALVTSAALTLTGTPAAHAGPPDAPPEFVALTQNWSQADWSAFSIMATRILDAQQADLARFYGALYDNDLARAGDRPAIERVIRRTFGPAGDWAVGIAKRESGLTATAVSRTGCRGIFQLALPLHRDLFPGQDWQAVWADPVANIDAAYRLYQGSGRAPWRL